MISDIPILTRQYEKRPNWKGRLLRETDRFVPRRTSRPLSTLQRQAPALSLSNGCRLHRLFLGIVGRFDETPANSCHSEQRRRRIVRSTSWRKQPGLAD